MPNFNPQPASAIGNPDRQSAAFRIPHSAFHIRMGIVLVGTSHKTAPVEVRERLAFAESRLAGALRELVDREMISEGLIVSTCNRVELIVATPNGAGQAENAVS